ncbi:hypothetical protein EDC56_3554 [Sinobacterium caligoides]|uniref:Transposase IS200-like domain-containing protein n=1 Tax=Sinobacterium caligoides TaxID=933926 RepID=A0A3N2DDT1_9GAMM|nr:transposase [Sinobacterium caligoides]ROR97887.1 hypothetical protein EDC56_3554 [Sinobacterium caligoides]
MPIPRKQLVSLADTPYYHCVSRCVRRAFLCGSDPYSGESYEHRRRWVESRALELARVFAIDICAYAVMSNHAHLVLRVDEAEAQQWSQRDVVERWHQLYKGNLLTQRFARGQAIAPYERDTLDSIITEYRRRLADISWFMRALNEPIARQANQEDGCTGRFWEGRFKSQALLDEGALLACMAYVDLNLVRAKMAKTPETSEHTSIRLRIAAAHKGEQPKELLPFIGNERQQMPKGLCFNLKDYVSLVDQTGRVIRKNKRGCISSNAEDVLARLNIPTENWLQLTTSFEQLFTGPVGATKSLDNYCRHHKRRRRHGATACRALFG